MKRTTVFWALACLPLCWACADVDVDPELGIGSAVQRTNLGPIPGLMNGTYTINEPSYYDDDRRIYTTIFSSNVQVGDADNFLGIYNTDWELEYTGTLFRVQQVSNDRYLDAYESSTWDYGAVTRPMKEGNWSQLWFFRKLEENSQYTIQQLVNERYLDAYASDDYAVVTRTEQNNDTQKWVLSCGAGSTQRTCRIQQVSTGRYLDAHESSSHDYTVVTRTYQDNDTQRWRVTYIGTAYTIRAANNLEFLDAYESETFAVVTRSEQDNFSQLWLAQELSDYYSFMQMSSGRWLNPFGSDAITAPYQMQWDLLRVE